MTRRDFVRRCKALGYPNPHAAAVALDCNYSHVYRIWLGERRVGPYVLARLTALETGASLKEGVRHV
jgi:hypothetical protein